ncbi:MAG: hypothetical protein U0520_02440 [Candidatus Saccharimonadales bacterium]
MVNVIAHTKKSIPLRDTNGSFLAAALIIMIVLTAIGISLAGMVVAQYSKTQRITYSTGALYTAEAGIEQTLYQLNQNDSFAGFPTEQVFSNSNEFGRAVYTSSIKNLAGGNAKTITTTAKTYNYNNASKPVSTRKIRVTVVGTGSEGYSVHTGPGGLILGGSANITNSDVFVNGRITMSGAARIGTNAQPVKVDVANQACPMVSNPGASYPQVCESGQPIDLQWSTYIYGSVCATGQTSYGPNPSKNILPGSGGLGLQLGCTAAPVSSLSYDRPAHIARMSTTGSMSNSNYNCSQWRNPDAFTRTWPANLTMTGNVDLSSSCDLTITGDVYITGNLNIGGAAKIRVADSVGTHRPVIVVDGSVTVGGSAQMLANTSGTGMHFISFKSNAPCNPSCTTITGTALKNTQNLETVSVGGAGNLPGMVFQAYWSKIKVDGSGNVGSAVGQTVDLSGAGTITFGTKLSSGAKTWTITSYQQVFE